MCRYEQSQGPSAVVWIELVVWEKFFLVPKILLGLFVRLVFSVCRCLLSLKHDQTTDTAVPTTLLCALRYISTVISPEYYRLGTT